MKLTTDYVTYSFDKDNKPAMKVSPPATVCVQTLDCYANQLTSEDIDYNSIDRSKINPATGPIYIEGAMPGDTLKVTVNKIDVGSQGVLSCGPGSDPTGKLLEKSSFRIATIDGNHANFLGKYMIPLNKMIGVIGTTPSDEPLKNMYPGKHGGNMDCKLIEEGAILYLPVFVEGALLGLGDVHAVMGDGEVGGSGVEVPADVTITIEVIKAKAPEYPVLENDDIFAVIASKETADEAIGASVQLMFKFLKDKCNLPDAELSMLMSMVGNLHICQIVDPLITARFEFPKKFMDVKSFFE